RAGIPLLHPRDRLVRLAEVKAGVDEDHRDRGIDAMHEVDHHGVGHGCGEDDVGAVLVDGPADDLLRAPTLEVGQNGYGGRGDPGHRRASTLWADSSADSRWAWSRSSG